MAGPYALWDGLLADQDPEGLMQVEYEHEKLRVHL